MPQLFIIIGFANWGKTFTLRRIFNRHFFFCTKGPIMIDGTTKKFTIINMSNDDVFIDEYIKTFKEVDRIHKWRNHNYVVTLCPVLTEGDRDCRKFLELVRGDFAIHVVTLGNNWKGNDSIDQSLANEICKSLRTKNQLYCREVINKQSALFNQRAEKIRQYLIKNSN